MKNRAKKFAKGVAYTPGMSDIPLVCKNCGARTFKVHSKPKTLDDFDGATCQKCGTKTTKKDIEVLASTIALDVLKKAGFKAKLYPCLAWLPHGPATAGGISL